MNIVPIVIFTYRRKIDELIKSLLKNKLAKYSNLYIFSDGYKNAIDKKDVLEVRESLKDISGFKNITIKESKLNNGLANSVIYGVTEIINQYTKVIVLEDDLIVADNFLDYMNEALEFYNKNQKIWSISGYTPNLECLNNYDKDIFLSVRASSWGWATWKDRWIRIDWDIKDWDDFKKDKNAIKSFNRAGNDMFKMLEIQMLGKIDSWAIRWCYNQFRFNAYTIYPTKSKLVNNGFDDKGTHNSDGLKRWEVVSSNKIVNFEDLKVNNKIIDCFAKKYNLQLKTRIGYLLKQFGSYRITKKTIKFIGAFKFYR